MHVLVELRVVGGRRLRARARGGEVKRYSARAPRAAIDQGSSCSAIAVSTPATKRSHSAVMRPNASSVRTSPSVARAAASPSALPARVPPTPPVSS